MVLFQCAAAVADLVQVDYTLPGWPEVRLSGCVGVQDCLLLVALLRSSGYCWPMGPLHVVVQSANGLSRNSFSNQLDQCISCLSSMRVPNQSSRWTDS